MYYTILTDAGAVEYGFHLISHSLALEHKKRYQALFNISSGASSVDNHDPSRSADRLSKNHPNSQLASESDPSRYTIVMYCEEYGNEFWGQWGPSNGLAGGKGMGGSEEAVVYLSHEVRECIVNECKVIE